MTTPGNKLLMKNGTPFEIHDCLEPGEDFTRRRLKDEIQHAIRQMSVQSRWQRFFSPIHELSEKQLDILTTLDGKDRVAWCAVINHEGEYRGIGLSRYVRLPEAPDVAEFAVTVIDEFHGEGIGEALLEKLIQSAQENGIKHLRGYIFPSNKGMLALSRHFGADIHRQGTVMEADIPC